ncbi:hypothetical protein [Microtetraspora malaysiensis]|uniref:hypothetical protein n=1 Tax=Microtetraspora malaysiensis TaxID=161358 RepID=UPI000B243AD2|nr:hypothetical protein [Microtetraspora malaysiensis]
MNNPPRDLKDEQIKALEQVDARTAFETHGKEAWTLVYKAWGYGTDHSGAYFSVLAPPALREQYLGDESWDVRIGDGQPGTITSYEKGQETHYFRYGNNEGWEPLVIITEQYGKRLGQTLLCEEFRLVFNLWEDKASGHFIATEKDGSETLVAEVTDDSVRIRTSYLARYRALKQLDMWLYVEVVDLYANLDLNADYTTHNTQWRKQGEMGFVHVRDEGGLGKVISLFRAKKFFAPPSIEASNVLGYGNRVENYPEFIIGENDDGSVRNYTSDYEALGNYFGKNPDAPHYLTPVFFRREVLQKYYENPELYQVQDGYLRCAGLWGIRVDNDHPDYVMVFLGDLGRDLPEAERNYWLGFNIPPEGPMSDTNMRRSFLGQWVDAQGPEHQFKRAYQRLNEEWQRRNNWPLYREPHSVDKVLIERLHAPLSESQREFEDQILSLAKLLVDFLNEKGITAVTGKGPEGEKGISKLERLLTFWQYPHMDRDVSLLRQIQTIRSQASAHSKGSSYDKFIAQQLDGRTKSEFVKDLLARAAQTLVDLSDFTPPKHSS